MSKHSYFIFSLCDRSYGINLIHVEEIFPLPEITPIPEASQGLIGVIDLRGEILPILDLSASLGARSPDYHSTDSLVVLNQAPGRVGIVVNQVHEIKEFSSEEWSTTQEG